MKTKISSLSKGLSGNIRGILIGCLK